MAVIPFDDPEEADETELDDVDLKVYFLASVLAIPTNTGSSSSSSSVLSSTRIVLSAGSFALPLSLSLRVAALVEVEVERVVVRLLVVVERGAALRGTLLGFDVIVTASTSSSSSEESRWMGIGLGREGPASG